MKLAYFDPFKQWPGALQALQREHRIQLACPECAGDLPTALNGAQVLVTGNRGYSPEVAEHIRAHGSSLAWIHFTTSGIDQARRAGLPTNVIVTNSAGLRAFSVAEHAFSLMLAYYRRILDAQQARGEQRWARDALIPLMDNLSGKVLVIIGVGAIARDIARKAKAFDMRVIGISRSISSLPNFDDLRPRSRIVETCAHADIVLLAALLEEGSERLLSKDVIRALPRHALVVNIARGELLDEDELLDALRNGRLAGAVLDVTTEEPLSAGHAFWSIPNVILTPHLGGAGSDGVDGSIASAVLTNLNHWLNGEPLERVVIDPRQ